MSARVYWRPESWVLADALFKSWTLPLSTSRMPSRLIPLFPMMNDMQKAALFEIEREGETIIFTPVTNLSEVYELHAREALDVLSDLSIKNLVMDFHKTDYFGSTTLGL